MKIEFRIDPDRLSLNDLILFQTIQDNGSLAGDAHNLGQLRNLLARITAGADGAYIEFAEAQGIIGEMPLGQLMEAIGKVKSKVKELQSEAVNPQTGNAS